MNLVGHAPAGLSALAAKLGTFLHHRIVRINHLTRLGTGIADLGAECAVLIVEVTLSQHHAGTHLTSFRTVHHELNVLRIGVLSSLSETVRDAAHAFFIAGEAVADTLIHTVAGKFTCYIL